MLLNMGVDLKIISDHLGHCDINVTADIYADVLSSTRKVLADFIIFHGVMTWMNGDIDIAPETMYAESYPYTARNVSAAVLRMGTE